MNPCRPSAIDDNGSVPTTYRVFTADLFLAVFHLPHSAVALLLSHVPVDVVARNTQLILAGKGAKELCKFGVGESQRDGEGVTRTIGRSASWHFVS